MQKVSLEKKTMQCRGGYIKGKEVWWGKLSLYKFWGWKFVLNATQDKQSYDYDENELFAN